MTTDSFRAYRTQLLHGYFESHQGQFLLTPLPGAAHSSKAQPGTATPCGRNSMAPLVGLHHHNIHLRVLRQSSRLQKRIDPCIRLSVLIRVSTIGEGGAIAYSGLVLCCRRGTNGDEQNVARPFPDVLDNYRNDLILLAGADLFGLQTISLFFSSNRQAKRSRLIKFHAREPRQRRLMDADGLRIFPFRVLPSKFPWTDLNREQTKVFGNWDILAFDLDCHSLLPPSPNHERLDDGKSRSS